MNNTVAFLNGWIYFENEEEVHEVEYRLESPYGTSYEEKKDFFLAQACEEFNKNISEVEDYDFSY